MWNHDGSRVVTSSLDRTIVIWLGGETLNGGKLVKSLSSKTDFLIAGENMGPKKKIMANKLNIKILSESKFISML